MIVRPAIPGTRDSMKKGKQERPPVGVRRAGIPDPGGFSTNLAKKWGKVEHESRSCFHPAVLRRSEISNPWRWRAYPTVDSVDRSVAVPFFPGDPLAVSVHAAVAHLRDWVRSLRRRLPILAIKALAGSELGPREFGFIAHPEPSTKGEDQGEEEEPRISRIQRMGRGIGEPSSRITNVRPPGGNFPSRKFLLVGIFVRFVRFVVLSRRNCPCSPSLVRSHTPPA